MGTRDWGLGAGKGQLKKIIKNFYHLFKNRSSPLFIW